MLSPTRVAIAALLTALPLTAQAGTEPASGLEAGLESVQTENIRADIHFIASDDMAGRDSPSPGLRIAARYIRSRLQRLGFQPGAEDGFFYHYPLRQLRMDAEASSLTLSGSGGELGLSFGSDYFLYSTTEARDSNAVGEIVFGGTGEREQLSELDLDGKWVLCWESDLSPLKRRNNAVRAGALGMLVAPGPEYSGEPYTERFASVLQRIDRGVVSWPSERTSQRPFFPQLFLSRSAIERGLALGEGLGTLELGQSLGLSANEVRVGEGTIQMENVCGFWPGSDEALANEVLIVSAHDDHVGTRNGEVYNGADDNGSGTCGLMALAEALAHYGPMRRSVMLIWVSAEEKGLWGSKAWARNPWLPEGCTPVANINIDMIGRNAPDELQITPTRERAADYNGIVRAAEALSALEGFPTLGNADAYYHRSDHAEFAKLGIPVSFLFADVHEDYHQPGDTPDKIDCDKIRRVVRLVLRMLDSMQVDALEL